MAEKAPCSCGCGKLVSTSADLHHHAGKTTPQVKATHLTKQDIMPQCPPPSPPLPSLSPTHPEIPNSLDTKDVELLVNVCAEAWTNASRYQAMVRDADSDIDDSEEEKEETPVSESEEDGDSFSSGSDSDSSDEGLRIEDTISDEFERELVEKLTEEELTFLRHYALKVEVHMANDTFLKLAFACPKSNVASWKVTKVCAKFLQHSDQWHTTAAFHHVAALLVQMVT
ncbi:hypothetical protein M413DRAFT_28897 [Hebeloma cylindrosporum]|uniref:Uncharacterized protein n=1 Tax=Hebeloma cylindrosporum TaxID=76867 RepID=A0A0C3C628_HEBCY|nr:hypothetical protein M413DRAFT_28897 [Hebeloma cylindrosporum h7]